MVGEKQVRELFGEFDCGCENREEIMGAGSWRLDASMIAAAVVFVAVVLIVMK